MDTFTYETIVARVDRDISYIFSPICQELSVPNNYYPCFGEWLSRVFLESTENRRTIIIARKQERIVGVNILKHVENEYKLCTFWVNPEYRHQHIGSMLLQYSFSIFNGHNAIISIPSCVLGDFSGLMTTNNYHFEFSHKVSGLYQPHEDEFFFRIQQSTVIGKEVPQFVRSVIPLSMHSFVVHEEKNAVI